VVTASCVAQNSGFNFDLHANSQVTAKEIGLPFYPGATPYKDGDSDSSANLGFALNGFRFSLQVAGYQTGDSAARVLDYYRKPLARYGEVLDCYKGRPVGALTVTRSGLSCSTTQNGHSQNDHIEVNGSSDSSDHELRAGTPSRYRIVGVSESKGGKTRFGLVYLEIPKDSGNKDSGSKD
jgi:hypothetical protein